MTNFLEEVKQELRTTQRPGASLADSHGSFDLVNLVLNATGSFAHGYHLEFAIHDAETTTAFCEMLAQHDIFAHVSNARVYIKDSESICNLLARVGAHKSLCKLNDAIVTRIVKNSTNRKTNCDTHNITRQIQTASAQIEKIRAIMSRPAFKKLAPELQQTARARAQHPHATYDELSAILGISKSALAHRIKRMLELNI